MLPEVELFPALEIGWFNGWILLVALYLAYGVLLLVFPRDVVNRLYEYNRSSWSRRHRAFYVAEKLLLVVYIILVVLTPLKTGSIVFIPGIILFSFGLTGFIIALFNFKNTPLDQPVSTGIYRVSRHPQVLMLFVAGIGIGIAIGSLFVIFIQIIASFFGRSRVLAEEQACLERYGDSYRIYMERVPRYVLIRTRMREENRR
jgi:protein-S-isoprenylcysteine O-methyltransferase Ste14